MKKNGQPFAILISLVLLAFLFSSCLKDKCRRTYTMYTPVYAKLGTLRKEVKSGQVADLVNAGKLYINGKWIFLNEQGKGIHVIDNSNPAHPQKVSFIAIPGNFDMYVRGNTLYADLYCDLLAMDISNPKNIAVQKFLTNTFPEKAVYTSSADPDSITIITSWASRDTTVDCGAVNALNGCINCSATSASSFYAAASAATKSNGMAGSMARFAAVNEYMYAVTSSNLNVINIADAANPLFVKRKSIGWNIETIFPYNNKLYIGAGSSMSIFDLNDPVDPTQSSWSGHWCSNDPVVADDNYAYVTLHEADACGSKINQLEIYDLKTANATLVKTYNLNGPQGLSKDGNLLFICDDGLKIYDATNVTDIKLIKQLPGTKTYDVIADNGIAYVVAKDGLYQYDYNNLQDVRLLSKLLK